MHRKIKIDNTIYLHGPGTVGTLQIICKDTSTTTPISLFAFYYRLVIVNPYLQPYSPSKNMSFRSGENYPLGVILCCYNVIS